MAGVLIVLVGYAGAGWYYAGQLLTPGGAALPDDLVAVEAIDDGAVTLGLTEDSQRRGVYGLAYDGGYAQVARVLDQDADSVRRTFEDVDQELAAGDEVDVDSYYFPEDPALAFDFPLQEVLIDGELGAFPAWLDKQSSEDWAIFVHGRGADRREGFRVLSVMHELGLSTLLISYRNDEGAPASASGLYGLGTTEWPEVHAAVTYALGQGADEIVLVGASTGGQIVSVYLHNAPPGVEAVQAVLFDAPALDWGRTLRQGARERELPELLVPAGMLAARFRGGIDWDQLDQIARADEFDVPILLFHGTADSTVPVSVADDFAAARPELVTYQRVEGAEHVAAWNADPAAYTRAVERLLEGSGILE